MQWRRIFRSRGFWLAVIIQCFAYLYPHMDTNDFWYTPLEYFGSADLLYFFLMPRTYGLCIFLIPFVAVLPASTFIAEDIQSGYIRCLLQRTGKIRYLRTRILQAAAGAAMASLLGSFIYLGFIMLACPWNDNILTSWREVMSQGNYAPLIQSAYGFPAIAEGISRFCIEAMTWSFLGFAFACWFKNTGLALALTFMAHYGLTYIFETYPSLFNYSPSTIAVPDIATAVPLLSYYLMQFAYLGITFLIGLIAATCISQKLAAQNIY